MDFLSHLLDAPLSNLLIVAGLLFLGIAAVGKVVGKIEPDKTGRIVSGVLGILLFFAGVSTHIASDSKKDHPKAEQSDPTQPVIQVFSVTPSHITKGGEVKISWVVQDADDVELVPFGQVPASGSRTDTPQQTTVYRLSATRGTRGAFSEAAVALQGPLPSGPEATCKAGFVWRQAVQDDHVCVPPAGRDAAAQQNREAASHRTPNGGQFGPDTCVEGFVWRDAFLGDHICVTPAERQQAANDNAQGPSRRVSP